MKILPKTNMENAGFEKKSSSMGPMFYVSFRKCHQFLSCNNPKGSGIWKFLFSSWKFISKNGKPQPHLDTPRDASQMAREGYTFRARSRLTDP